MSAMSFHIESPSYTGTVGYTVGYLLIFSDIYSHQGSRPGIGLEPK